MPRNQPVKLDGHPAILLRPDAARWLYLLCHGAGAGMRHSFLAAIATALARHDVATLRWELPYMAAQRRRPDPPEVCEAAVRAVNAAAASRWPELRRIAGGKSFGGRMTSRAAVDGGLPGVAGLAFLGFPLHPPDKPGIERADHLGRVAMPMLFLQGTRDELADLALLRPVLARIGARATLVVIDGADHGFAVPRRDVIAELAGAIARWIEALPPRAEP